MPNATAEPIARLARWASRKRDILRSNLMRASFCLRPNIYLLWIILRLSFLMVIPSSEGWVNSWTCENCYLIKTHLTQPWLPYLSSLWSILFLSCVTSTSKDSPATLLHGTQLIHKLGMSAFCVDQSGPVLRGPDQWDFGKFHFSCQPLRAFLDWRFGVSIKLISDR